MALSQDDRISISKKIIDIPRQNASADTVKDQLEGERKNLEKEDSGNRSLQDAETALINPYQVELSRYDGNGRTEVSESDMVGSADRVFQAPFFPNDANTPLPDVPDGGWKFFVPFSGGKGVGRNYQQAFNPTQKEQDLVDAINAQIAIIEGLSDATRSTGDFCETGGTCSLPAFTNQADCVGNGGIWTPGGPDVIGPDPVMQQAATDLKNAVQAWEDFINGTLAVIPTDSDATRQAQNDAATQNGSDTVAEIDSWQTLQDFDTATSIPTTCAGFNSLSASDFDPSKFRADELQIIKDAINFRTAYVSTRISQIGTNLGTVTQDFNTGEITGGTGFYGKRFRFIDMRLNGMAGSLTKLKGIQRGQGAQDSLKASNDSAALALTSIITASQFRAPATGSSTVHVLDGSGFSGGDSAFVVSDTQSEIEVTIQSVDGNRIVLDRSIPEKYRHTEGARLYKVL